MNIEIQSEECVLKCGIPNVGASIQSQPGNRYQRWANIITAMQLTFGVEKFQEEFDNVTLEELLAYSKGL